MTTPDELIGGRYRLGSVIGFGGMADVYSANDTLLGRDVAVKMMRADMARDHNFVERFRREAQNAAQLNHPCIVSVFDTGETKREFGDVPYIVMELVRGETLRDIVRNNERISVDKAAGILADVCDALAFSHEAGIIHRDIKPANIMITSTGTVKVMDFGIARALGEATSMTQTAAVIGTAQYLSPEQARGRSADGRSDLYAVGCVLYEAVTGQPPFSGETSLSVAYQHVQDEPEEPSRLIPDLTNSEATAIDAVVLTALAKDPADRYDNAADMAKDLRRLASGQVPLAARAHAPQPQPANDPQTAEFMPQAAAGAGAAGVAGGVGAAGVADAQRGARRTPAPRRGATKTSGARRSPRRPKDYPSRPRLWPVVAILAVLGLAGGALALNVFGGDITSPSNANRGTVTVPDVAGKPTAEAERILNAANLKVSRRQVPHPDVPKGTAIGTDPEPSTVVDADSTVILKISNGPKYFKMPKVIGLNADEARKRLERAGLEVDSRMKEEPSDTIAEGDISGQDPEPGKRVSEGSTVRLVVSSGREISTVPDVSGRDVADARQTLENAGYRVSVTEVDSTEEAGRVISTTQAGAQLEHGETVEIRVSRGNQMRMPYLMGKTMQQAESELRAAGFTGPINQTTRPSPDPRQINIVASQTPAPDQIINKDEPVDLEVYVLGL
ncbi:Stk1 family PASTA domain-containing Ser/Thr kinase [Corynebacterium sp. TAE3-ERU12]|uniref:Stk1 family PASTA domain-containing Ser/Thr kinase n=1 Tax=Corynebacterium sp. TAE3-ERU12 TaxID=2849491 RepID=UPI001C47135E|nr:Stk1 family PASTA domain-containing Ser/Thr kinase [Corynebacterium sp. TAE3-ERU12]MBV7294362.1 Stk1 family PASTA domain-containing Ser/Thr kinase [Corynebacterium sp. TAE3-ERU12]